MLAAQQAHGVTEHGCCQGMSSARLGTQVPDGEHVICALSGGVDSTVAATLVHAVLGDRLHCVFVDNGLLRYKVLPGRGPACIRVSVKYSCLVL